MITDAQRQELVRLRIEQAEHTYQLAWQLTEAKEFATAINRIYYGMFYALLALGLKNGYETSKHQQLLGWFNKEFVNTKKVSKELGKIVKKAFDRRMNADYELLPMPQADEMQSLLAEMQLFITSLKDYITT
jgi:uncharacterized protein (UPF0332 family)